MHRLWDESYNGGNVAAILAHNQWRPVRTHYPTLSYAPHSLVLKTYEMARQLPALRLMPATFGVLPNGRAHLRPLGLRICRSIHSLVGVLSLWVLFKIAGRLFGSFVGLGAVFLLSVAPWHLRQSGIFKPDIMLVFVSLLALWAMLEARRTESVSRYAAAGALVGAAAAAKWNGAALLIPLLVTIALGGIKEKAALSLRVGVATTASATVLLALNPWLLLTPDLYRRHLTFTVNQYEERTAEVGAGLFDQPLSVIIGLASSVYFGPVLGTCVVLGLGTMLVFAVRSWRTPETTLPGAHGRATVADIWILLSCFWGYVGALWVVTRFPKAPNWAIVAPVAALAGGWFIALLLATVRTAPTGWKRAICLGSLALVLCLAGAEKFGFVNGIVYDENVPLTSTAAAQDAGKRKPLRGRTFLSELQVGNQDFDRRVWDGKFVPTLVRTHNIADEPELETGTADALLFPASRLEPGQDATYRELAAGRSGADVKRFEPKLFRLRGDPVLLVRRHFVPLGPPQAASFVATGAGVYDAELPDAIMEAAGQELSFVSIEIAIQAPSEDEVKVAVEVDGKRIPCRHTQKGRDRRRCLTPRYRASSSPATVFVQPPREVIDVISFHWRQAG